MALKKGILFGEMGAKGKNSSGGRQKKCHVSGFQASNLG
jgi:hypothetical protein